MKGLLISAILLFSFTFSYAQHEYAPVEEHEIKYKDWTYKSVANSSDGEINLRSFAHDKKLVMVVYFAQWCPNWKHDVKFVESLYEKYHSAGMDVIAVGEYDPVDSMKTHIAEFKLPFTVVWE